MTIDVMHDAVIPGVAVGLGYLATFRVAELRRKVLEPSWLLIGIALTWQCVILPLNIIGAFLNLPWTWALLVFPSILIGGIMGGRLVGWIGDKAGSYIGPLLGLASAINSILEYLHNNPS